MAHNFFSSARRIWTPLVFVAVVTLATVFWQHIPQRVIANRFYVEGLEQFRRNNMPQAEALFSKTLSWNPRHIRAAEYLVLIAAPRGDYVETLRRFEGTRRMGSSWVPLYSIAAALNFGQGKLREARQILEEGIIEAADSGQDSRVLRDLLGNIQRAEEALSPATPL